jgi:signal transduction histidine kinase
MQDVVPTGPVRRWSGGRSMVTRFVEYLPRGNMLDEKAWRRRHRLLQWVLVLHVPGLVGLGLLLGHPTATIGLSVLPTLVCLVIGHLVTHHRWASFFITGGLVFCSIALVLLSRGSIEAHFHFFIIIGFIALYQDWVPFLWNVAFTVLSHGIGTIWLGGQIFNHPAAQQHPWLWSFIHGVAVLLACIGMVIFWRVTEDEQTEKEALGRQLITADAEIGRRQFTSDMLVNLARRNQSMLYRQLDIINQLEDKERDPDALADLFKLDHLATRVRRNAESLLVLAGELAPRTWSAPVALRDVVRAAIAETEDLDRVVFAVDDRVAVSGASVADLTHLLAELTENAVRFSPPETAVTIRARPNRRDEGGQLLTVEDWGVGMPPDDLAEANDLLAHPREVDLAVSQRLGFHVVARLAARHGITVSLSTTPGSGITAVVVLPAALFTPAGAGDLGAPVPVPGADGARAYVGDRAAGQGEGRTAEWADALTAVDSGRGPRPGSGPGTRNGDAWLPPEAFAAAPADDTGPTGPEGRWRGWWNPEVHGADGAGFGAPTPSGSAAVLAEGTGGNGRRNGQGEWPGPNGSGPNGHGASGHAANGRGANGLGPSGHGANGTGPSGHAPKGHSPNGHGADGHASNGHSRAGGQLPTGPGGTGDGMPRTAIARTDGAARDGVANGSERSVPARPEGGLRPVDADRSRGDEARTGAARADDLLAGLGATGDGPRDDAPHAGSREPADRARIPDARQESAPFGIDRRPPAAGPADGTGPRPFPAVPTAMIPPAPGPTPALPHPRADEPTTSEAPATRPGPSGAVRGRGLRRRVPQSHLAPELRHLTHGGLADTAVPLSADAAASALSRYQASRAAAQAVVDVAGASSSMEEGERA